MLVCYGHISFPLSREHFGNDVINVEEGKKENRSAFAKFLSMADFLDVSMRWSQAKYTPTHIFIHILSHYGIV